MVDRTVTDRREMTLVERLADERILFLWGPIDDKAAGNLIMRMLELEAKSRDTPVNLYINSMGGLLNSALAIYDTMQFVSCGVSTMVVGIAASAAAVIALAGTKGQRSILPNARMMLHQPWGSVTGQTEDIVIQAEECAVGKAAMNRIIAQHTGNQPEKIAQAIERDKYMSAEQAVEFGAVDVIVERREQ